jgi:hypothetical protein
MQVPGNAANELMEALFAESKVSSFCAVSDFVMYFGLRLLEKGSREVGWGSS